jgi:coenzyme F420 hydrogenase subunit beta
MNRYYEILMNNIIEPNYCCGCGICAGVCHQNVLKMDWNEKGALTPKIENIDSCTNCGLCIKVCPFVNENENEDELSDKKFSNITGIKSTSEAGYYLNTYVGYAKDDIRLKSASGGLLTLLLKNLLKQKKVDHVITIEPTLKSKKLFKFTIATTEEELLKCTGSVYYPSEMSDVIKHLLKVPGNYAIIGLPCALKALELLKGTNKKAKSRIKYTIGLTCGQLKTRRFTDFLFSMTSLKFSQLTRVIYRKIKGPKNSDFRVEFTNNEKEKEDLDWYPHVAPIWGGELFKLKSCFHCDDIFAECADATFMDAWLPEYTREYKGVSLAIIRNPELDSIFHDSPNIESISIDKVIESQDMVIKSKRGFRDIIDKKAKKAFSYVPTKRNLTWNKTNIGRFEKRKKLMKYYYSNINLNFETKKEKRKIYSVINKLNAPPLSKRVIRKIKRIPSKIMRIIK